MTNEKKLKVIEEAFNYYHDRTSLTSKEEKELLLLVNELYAAINYTQCCTELKTFDIHECINEVSDEAQRRSFAVYDLKEDRSFRYGVKKAIDKMLYNK